MQKDVAEALLQMLAAGQQGALATVVRVAGSTPQKPGARLLLRADDSIVGTVGGGAIEQCVMEALRKARNTGESEFLVRDLGHDLAMCCGGRMELFIEPIGHAPRLLLCGAGHVARHTAQLARGVGFQVSVLDEREELNTEQRFPECHRELIDPGSYLRRSPPAAQDFVLVTTHDHHLDETVLERALESSAHYIGLVGSQRKVFRLLERIVVRGLSARAPEGALRPGFDQGALDRVFAPVGLDIGAVGPEEIALSVVAELVAIRRGTRSQHMRAVDDPRFRRLLSFARAPEGALRQPREDG